LIVNPVSGSREPGDLVVEATRRLRELGYQPDVFLAQPDEDVGRFAAGLDRKRVAAVVVFGGDGTVSRVAGGLLDDPIPIILLPTGTENLLARELGYRLDVELLCQILQAGRECRMDVGEVNGRRFLIVTGVGFDAHVVHRLDAQRQGHITHLSYFWPIWQTFWQYRFPPVRVTVDGRQVHDGPGLAFVGNIDRYALGLHILAHADWTDGKLDVCVFPCSSHGQLLWHSFMTAVQYHVQLPDVVYVQGRDVLVESPEEVLVEIDGDPAGKLPARYGIIQGGARFLLPPDWEGSTEP
jgi:diacylglycerol kinase (ATP)